MSPVQSVNYVAGPDLLCDVTDRSRHAGMQEGGITPHWVRSVVDALQFDSAVAGYGASLSVTRCVID
jgi:hypothetical protein